MPASPDPAATERQLRYLRALAHESATTFTYPHTREQASREITRLRRREPAPAIPSEPKTASEPPHYATEVRRDEVSGFGSTATWRTSPSAPHPPHTPKRQAEHPTELARYRVSGGARVMYGERIKGCLRITDHTRSGPGRSYIVERDFEGDGHPALMAMLADYIARAREFDEVPMAPTVVRQLFGLASPGA